MGFLRQLDSTSRSCSSDRIEPSINTASIESSDDSLPPRSESNCASSARSVAIRWPTLLADRFSNSVSYWWNPTAVPLEGEKANDESKYVSANWLNAEGAAVPVVAGACSLDRHAAATRTIAMAE